MVFLLDTHTLIWMMEGDSRLSKTVSEAILDEENDLFVSTVSFWEISIKRSLGKLNLAHDTAHFWNTAQNQGIRLLNIQTEHLTQLEKLPFHHKDPFDRMMISQAIVEEMTILTKDSKFEPYDIKTLWRE